MRHDLIPGHNVDKVDIEAGLKELTRCGYDGHHTHMVVAYALNRHARGEEDRALRNATEQGFYGINLTSWYRVLAAAISAAQEK